MIVWPDRQSKAKSPGGARQGLNIAKDGTSRFTVGGVSMFPCFSVLVYYLPAKTFAAPRISRRTPKIADILKPSPMFCFPLWRPPCFPDFPNRGVVPNVLSKRTLPMDLG